MWMRDAGKQNKRGRFDHMGLAKFRCLQSYPSLFLIRNTIQIHLKEQTMNFFFIRQFFFMKMSFFSNFVEYRIGLDMVRKECTDSFFSLNQNSHTEYK